MEAPTESNAERKLQHTRTFVDRVALVIIGICLGAGCIELAMWSIYDQPWYDKLTGEQADTSTKGYTRNRFGLRNAPYPIPPPEGSKRTLVFGDSFTFGLGVKNDRYIFPYLLEFMLNERLQGVDADSFHVMNAGIPGSLTGAWLDLWKKMGTAYDPDLVLIVFFLRDGTLTHSIPQFFGVIQEEITERNRISLLYQGSYTYRRIRDNLDRKNVGARYTQAFHDSYFGDESQTKEWRAAQENLLELRDLAVASGAKVAFAIFPVLVELNEHYPFKAICDLLESFARENDMPVLNLLPSYLGHRSDRLWVSSFDQHPNAAGHVIAAEALFPFVSGLLVDSTQPRPQP